MAQYIILSASHGFEIFGTMVYFAHAHNDIGPR